MKNKNKGYLGNKNLPGKGSTYSYTPEQLKELAKCSEDIHYFSEKYFTIVHVDHGKMKIPLYPYQKNLLTHIKENRFSCVLSSRQSGKCFCEDTIVNVRNKKTGEIKAITVGELYKQERN